MAAINAQVVQVIVALLGATQEREGTLRHFAVRAACSLVSQEFEFLFNCGGREKERSMMSLLTFKALFTLHCAAEKRQKCQHMVHSEYKNIMLPSGESTLRPDERLLLRDEFFSGRVPSVDMD